VPGVIARTQNALWEEKELCEEKEEVEEEKEEEDRSCEAAEEEM